MDFWRDLFTFNPRRKAVVIQPGLQLKLPLYLLVLTMLFAGLFALNGYLAYERMLTIVLQETGAAQTWKQIIEAQTGSFLVVSGALAVGYVLALMTISVIYAHRMVGPTVAFRRQIEALKNGDFAARVHLRRGDAFFDVADDLNELAELLGSQEKRRSDLGDGVGGWSGSAR